MKTNDYLFVSAVAAYSYLFYEQNAGINFLVFDALLITILLIRNPGLLKEKNWLTAALLCLISGIGILINSSALAIIANCFSLLILSAFSFNCKTSSLFSFLFSCYSVASSIVFVFIDAILRYEKKKEDNSSRKMMALAVVLVVFIIFLFFIIYKASNPLFAENTKWINLDFISFGWVAFTVLGLFLVYGLFYHKTIPVIESWENTIALNNSRPDSVGSEKYNVETFAGILLFVFLNFMLIILNIGDIQTIWFKGELPKGITHTDFVHEGVGMVILSIIIAVSLIMFLDRKDFRDLKNSKVLKSFIYLWIVQNVIMLFSTACRNYIYIDAFNLTYLRIGVYAWLILAVFGLFLVFIKLHKQKSNWFLIRANVSLWFCMLTLSSLVNWDVLLTRYNLSNKTIKDVDFHYLFSLSDANLPELIELGHSGQIRAINSNLKKSSSTDYNDNFMTYSEELKNKTSHFLKNYVTSWQSWDFRDKKITESIFKKSGN